jgi:hypothetical protein
MEGEGQATPLPTPSCWDVHVPIVLWGIVFASSLKLFLYCNLCTVLRVHCVQIVLDF